MMISFCGCARTPGTVIDITPPPVEAQPPAVEPEPDAAWTPGPDATAQIGDTAEASGKGGDIAQETPNMAEPVETEKPVETVKPMETEKPTDTPAPRDVSGQPLKGIVIGVDPGHQAHANRDPEPVSPGSDETKHKVSSGTKGIETGIAEYKVNLAVGLLLQKLLEKAGATVIMTRTTDDVDISNVERAQLFNEKRTDYAIRLHCNGSDDHDKRGAFMLVPKENPFKADCERAAQLVIDEYCAATGIKNRGLTYRGDQTGFNWCERMVINIEMGHMTNADEDKLLTNADFQVKMAQGIFNGILKFYE